MQFHIVRHAVVKSTMDEARELAARGAPEGTVVLADAQTAGRGRAGHTWHSPPGQSLYLSVVLRPRIPPPQAGWITMSAALAVIDTLEDLRDTVIAMPFSATLKWFNDVLLNARKVCGILVESSITGDRFDYAVLGIGLNINATFDDAPAEVRQRATSLRREFGIAFDRERILASLLRRVGERQSALSREQRSPAKEYARHVETLGKDVEIETGQGLIRGRAARIADDGSLIVATDQGEVAARFGDLVRQVQNVGAGSGGYNAAVM
ncbi:MAG: biotin--[acetyl-CoA-carboxylase] ligase [Anaerolineae bacterium]